MNDLALQCFAATWGVLAVFWLAATRKYSCWPVTVKDYVWPIAPPALAAFTFWIAGNAAAPLLRVLLTCFIVMWCFLTIVWQVSVAARDSSIMDIAYALCTVVMAWTEWWLLGADTSPRTLLILAVVNLWGWRYTIYVANRNLPHGEDARYARWRERTGAPWWWWSYFQVFLVQAVMVGLWYIPLGLALTVPGNIGALELVAAAVWLTGFIFEAGADWQLSRFKRDPASKGKILNTGFWSQCRHPNYFGEAAMWCAYGLFGLAHPLGFAALACTAYTVHMMNGGSATRMTDGYMKKKKPGYLEYVARTPAFLPRMFGGRP